MKLSIEAKLCWGLGSLFILGYTFFAWSLHSSWMDLGLNPDWWVTVVPWSVFTFATELMFILTYKSCKNHEKANGD